MNSIWQRFWKLSPLERGMFFHSLWLLPMTACGLRLIGLRNVESMMNSQVRRDQEPASGNASNRQRVANAAARMTEAASRYGVTRGNCLSKSLVLWHLLRRHGLGATLRVGGRKRRDSFEAHAWVELAGRSLDSSRDIQRSFVPFKGELTGSRSEGK